jgi:hypothetical protein
MDKPWKVILAFVGVFMAGVVFGGVFAFRVDNRIRHERPAPQPTVPPVAQQQPQPEPARKVQPQPAQPAPPKGLPVAILRQYTRRLNLTAEQQKRIQPFLARGFEDSQRLNREHLADTSRVYERMFEDVSAVLSPEQRIQLEKMRQEALERQRQARMKVTGGAAETKLEGANRADEAVRQAPVVPTKSPNP